MMYRRECVWEWDTLRRTTYDWRTYHATYDDVYSTSYNSLQPLSAAFCFFETSVLLMLIVYVNHYAVEFIYLF